MSAEFEKRFLASAKRDPAFISKGFTYWKDGTRSFNKHMASGCHREAVAAMQVVVGDIGKLLSTQHEREKAQNRAMFRRILQNLCFLACQCLALRGHVDREDSNFTQMLRLRAFDYPEVMT